MSFYDIVLIPILFGLIGFFEPCSLGTNIIILNRTNKMSKLRRLYETTSFTLVRGFFLAIIGLSAAYVGSKFITVQSSLFLFLGTIYILLGIFSIVNKYHPIFTSDINLTKHFKNRGSLSLGILFGFVIPACAIAFVIALVTKTLIVGDLFGGFITLFIFGITLSAPLIIISYFDKSNQIVQKIFRKTNKVKWLAGVILIAVGILTMLTSIWWAGALQ